MVGGFPAKGMVAGWLKAGIFEAGKGFAPTGEGTPQGGVISPLLLNIALHGLEEAAGVRYHTGTYAGRVKDGCPALTRYADDLVLAARFPEHPYRLFGSVLWRCVLSGRP